MHERKNILKEIILRNVIENIYNKNKQSKLKTLNVQNC